MAFPQITYQLPEYMQAYSAAHYPVPTPLPLNHRQESILKQDRADDNAGKIPVITTISGDKVYSIEYEACQEDSSKLQACLRPVQTIDPAGLYDLMQQRKLVICREENDVIGRDLATGMIKISHYWQFFINKKYEKEFGVKTNIPHSPYKLTFMEESIYHHYLSQSGYEAISERRTFGR